MTDSEGNLKNNGHDARFSLLFHNAFMDGQRDHIFEALFENSPTAIALYDVEGLIIRCNLAFEKLFGYPLDEIHGKPLAGLIASPAIYPEVQKNIHRAVLGEVIETSGFRQRKDGKPVFVKLKGIPIHENGESKGALMFYQGLSLSNEERKISQDVLQFFESIMNGIDSEIYVSDMDTYEVLFMNKHMIGSFGKNLIGKCCYQAFCGLDAPCAKCTNHLLLDAEGAPRLEPVVWEDQNELTGKWYKNSNSAIRWLDGHYVRLQISTDISAQKKVHEVLSQIAMHDALTGLPNRVLFFDRLDQALRLARRKVSTLAVFFIDLDKFKTINDRFGHHCGDLVLQETARRMSACLRDCDTLARNSGDEFTILLEQMPSSEVAAVAERIIQVLREPMILEGNSITLSVSVGISMYPKNGFDADSLVKHADSAMYLIKKNGGNGYGF